MAGHHPQRIKVLHVDDDPQFAEMAATFLQRESDRIQVTTESSVEDGLATFRDGSFDCIVSDYAMPGKDGLAFLQTVREEYPDLPFIFFTGKGSETVAGEAIRAGVTDYIQKGSGTEQYSLLANRIDHAVSAHRAVQEVELSHRAMDTATEGLSLVQPDGTFSYVNPAFAQLFGYDPPELIGSHWTILYHNDEAERLEGDILPAVVDTGYWAGETVRLTKGGERLVTDHRLAHTSEGVIVCTAKDLTEERVAAGDWTSGFDLLLDAIEEYAFCTLDHEGYLTRWNAGAERLTGYQASDVIGKHISTFFVEEDREADLPTQLIETATSEGMATDEGWRLRADGSRFRGKLTLAASYDESGTIRGFGQLIQELPDQQES